ncbi:hypothetical protein [Roseicyclus marinus]|uniref:hypothetical protein n=1 Tax=Roseicyclus marinus TaxID=2161673 RepID=UPI0024102BE2|nr:hypothetical protein [Roseicyclus marinus]MDG3040436.1 hypothetical protein [Roseicyclus marinus]
MLEGYVAAGFDPLAFWRLTPRLYQHHMRGAQQRAEREHQGRAWLAWHTAALTRVAKLPKFEAVAGPSAASPRKRRQTPEEVARNLKMLGASWNAKRVH